MSSLEDLVPRLKGAVEDTTIVEQVRLLRTNRDASLQVSTSVLTELVKHFVSEDGEATTRRWVRAKHRRPGEYRLLKDLQIGVLLLELLLGNQKLVDYWKDGSRTELQILGQAMLATTNEVLKIVVGRIIHVCISKGVPRSRFFPLDEHKNIKNDFPANDSSQWLTDFEHFLKTTCAGTEPTEGVYFVMSAATDEKPIAKTLGKMTLIIGKKYATIVTPPPKSIHFIDLPLRSIGSSKWVALPGQGKPEASQGKEREDMSAQVHLALTDPNEFLSDAVSKTANSFRITFWDVDEAKDALREIRTARDASLLKTHQDSVATKALTQKEVPGSAATSQSKAKNGAGTEPAARYMMTAANIHQGPDVKGGMQPSIPGIPAPVEKEASEVSEDNSPVPVPKPAPKPKAATESRAAATSKAAATLKAAATSTAAATSKAATTSQIATASSKGLKNSQQAKATPAPQGSTSHTGKRKMRDQMQRPPGDDDEDFAPAPSKRAKKESSSFAKGKGSSKLASSTASRQQPNRGHGKAIEEVEDEASPVPVTRSNVQPRRRGSRAKADDSDRLPQAEPKSSKKFASYPSQLVPRKTRTRPADPAEDDDVLMADAEHLPQRSDSSPAKTRSHGHAENIELVSDKSACKPALVAWSSTGPINQGTPRPRPAKSYKNSGKSSKVDDDRDELGLTEGIQPDSEHDELGFEPEDDVLPDQADELGLDAEGERSRKAKRMSRKPQTDKTVFKKPDIPAKSRQKGFEKPLNPPVPPRAVSREPADIKDARKKAPTLVGTAAVNVSTTRSDRPGSAPAAIEAEPEGSSPALLPTKHVVKRLKAVGSPTNVNAASVAAAAQHQSLGSNVSQAIPLSDNSPEPSDDSEGDNNFAARIAPVVPRMNQEVKPKAAVKEAPKIAQPVLSDLAPVKTKTSATEQADRDTGSQLSKRVSMEGSPYSARTRLPLEKIETNVPEPQDKFILGARDPPKLYPSFIDRLRASDVLKPAPKPELKPEEKPQPKPAAAEEWDDGDETLVEQVGQENIEFPPVPAPVSKQHRRAKRAEVAEPVMLRNQQPQQRNHRLTADEKKAGEEAKAALRNESTSSSTPSNTTSQSTTNQALSQPSYAQSPSPEDAWTAALEPHQRGVADVLAQVTRNILTHLTNTTHATSASIRDLHTNGARLIAETGAAHEAEAETARVELDRTLWFVRERQEDFAALLQVSSIRTRERVQEVEEVVRSVEESCEGGLGRVRTARERFCGDRGVGVGVGV